MNMKDMQTKEKFIDLRSQGYSFEKISKELDVSKPTLIKWNSEFSKEITNARFLAVEALLDRFHQMKTARLETFSKMLDNALKELEKRTMSTLTVKELLTVIKYFEDRLINEVKPVSYTTDEVISPWKVVEEAPIQFHLFE